MILDTILADKRAEVEARRKETPLENLRSAALSAPRARGFRAAISRGDQSLPGVRTPASGIRLIAEVKKASPSKGLIRPDFDPVAIASRYEETGASAISVLTDEKYFQGRLEYLTQIKSAVTVPLLRKDFIVDPYQVYESRAAGGDAILLIVAAVLPRDLSMLMSLAQELAMDSLVEVHTAEELDIALEAGAQIVGINNRNLQTFETRLETTLEMARRVPGERVLVSESGIFTRTDVERLMDVGVDAILVGESLMREPDPGAKVRELLGTVQDV